MSIEAPSDPLSRASVRVEEAVDAPRDSALSEHGPFDWIRQARILSLGMFAAVLLWACSEPADVSVSPADVTGSQGVRFNPSLSGADGGTQDLVPFGFESEVHGFDCGMGNRTVWNAGINAVLVVPERAMSICRHTGWILRRLAAEYSVAVHIRGASPNLEVACSFFQDEQILHPLIFASAEEPGSGALELWLPLDDGSDGGRMLPQRSWTRLEGWDGLEVWKQLVASSTN